MTKTSSAGLNETLKHFPPESHPWVGKITFSFGYPEQGWIQFAITSATFVQGVIVHLSNVFDPFPEFIRWLGDIADGNLPSEFVIDEEGEEKVFRSSPFNEDKFIFEILELLYGENKSEEQPTLLYVQVAKKQFISEFLKRWDDFLKDQYDPVPWEEYGSDLRKMDVSKLRKFVSE